MSVTGRKVLILLLPQFPYRSEDFQNEQSPTTLPRTPQETYRKHAGNDLERMNKKFLKRKQDEFHINSR